MQVRADAVAHVHGGDLYARVATGPLVCASALRACKTIFFWVALLIRAMTSCFLFLLCNSVEKLQLSLSFLLLSEEELKLDFLGLPC